MKVWFVQPLLQDHISCTALHYAAHYGHPDCVSQLLPLSEVRLTDHQGCTPLHISARQGHADCVARLIPSGSPNQGDPEGEYAASLGGSFWIFLRIPSSLCHDTRSVQFKRVYPPYAGRTAWLCGLRCPSSSR